jgi:hypothetical protein
MTRHHVRGVAQATPPALDEAVLGVHAVGGVRQHEAEELHLAVAVLPAERFDRLRKDQRPGVQRLTVGRPDLARLCAVAKPCSHRGVAARDGEH